MKSSEDRVILSIVGSVLIMGICLTLGLMAMTGKLKSFAASFSSSDDAIKSARLESVSAGSVGDPEAHAALSNGDWKKAIARLESLLAAGATDPGISRALGVALFNLGVEILDDENSGKDDWNVVDACFKKSDAILSNDEDHRARVSRGFGSIGLKLYEDGAREMGKRKLESAKARHPEDPYLCYLIGAIKAAEGYYAEAQPLLAKGEQSPDQGVRAASAEILARISDDVKTEATFSVAENSRITMRFEGAPRPELAAKIQTILASQEGNIASIVGKAPGRKIEVIIYTSDQFAQARGLPDWVGGLFDGRIRVSAGDASAGDERLRQILAHEYAHAAVYDLLGQGAPGWLDEGIAQVAEFGATPPIDQLRSRIAAAGWIPISSLTSSFTGMNSTAASGAYAQSYLVVGFIYSRGGPGAIQSLLGFLSRGADIESALRQSLGLSLSSLDAETRSWAGM